MSGWLYASEARRCPESFEVPCKDCGSTYECAKDCKGMAMMLGGMVTDPSVVLL